jgi:hypothetical protein
LSAIRLPSFLGSLGLRSFLGPLGFLANPYVLIAAALAFSHGYVYWKGKRAAYREQAAAVLAINADIAKWRDKYEAAERASEERLRDAQTTATTILNAQTSDQKCLLTEALAQAVMDVSGD